MSEESFDAESHELLKDELNPLESKQLEEGSEFSALESQLSRHQGKQTAVDFSNAILNHQNSQGHLIKWMQLVAVFLIAFGSISLLSMDFNSQASQNAIVVDNKIEGYLKAEFPSDKGDKQHSKKLYAFYFSSLHCKPCKDFIAELNHFNHEMRKTNNNFEIIFIELKSDAKYSNFSAEVSFAKLQYKALKNKAFFNQYKSKQYGPSFVVLDNQGKVMARHEKGLYKQSFSKVLTQFSNIITKG